jgi:hypothetical protein
MWQNHPENYKGCTIYKRAYIPLGVKQYIPPAQKKNTLQTQLGITYAQVTRQNSYAPRNIEQEPHTNQSSANQWYARLTKHYEKTI